ncbi:MAG TPA: DOMON-like domain-containing protein [Sphingomicrobium sp.]|nr:DOMON-like domain-containing protein [Sphingomicrobium sp.]
MQFNLEPHPATPPAEPPFKVWASVDHAGAFGATATTNIWFGIGAPVGRFVIPVGEPGRADDLWQSTCFEAFLRSEGETYREWNFAANGQWAAYDFRAYRERTGPADVSEPYLRMEDNFTWWAMGATIAVEAQKDWQLGLSAILEEQDGTKSYWALAHPEGDKPDFHDPVCFAARLA